jgi:hypothetical protein
MLLKSKHLLMRLLQLLLLKFLTTSLFKVLFSICNDSRSHAAASHFADALTRRSGIRLFVSKFLRDVCHVCIRGVTADSDFFLAGLMWVSNNYNAKRATQNNRTRNRTKQRYTQPHKTTHRYRGHQGLPLFSLCLNHLQLIVKLCCTLQRAVTHLPLPPSAMELLQPHLLPHDPQ